MNLGPKFLLAVGYRQNAVTFLDGRPAASYWSGQRMGAAFRFQKPFCNWVLRVAEEGRPLRIAVLGCGARGTNH